MFTRLFVVVILGLALSLSQANAQVEFPSTRSSEGEIKRSVESIDNFLYFRANIRLSEPVKTRLVTAEQQVALGANSRLTSEQLINVLTEVALKRLPAPEILAQEISENLQAALEQFNSIYESLTNRDR